MSKTIGIVLAIIVLGALGWYAFSQRSAQPTTNAPAGNQGLEDEDNTPPITNEPTGDTTGTEVKDPITGSARNSNTGSQGTLVGGVREFTMDAYYDPEAKKPYFTLGEMVVQKGDKVRVKVKNTFGKHDFTIDEYNVNTVTPQDEVTTIEFTADKAGDFVYYCSSTGHRASGQWGMLKVQE